MASLHYPETLVDMDPQILHEFHCLLSEYVIVPPNRVQKWDEFLDTRGTCINFWGRCCSHLLAFSSF